MLYKLILEGNVKLSIRELNLNRKSIMYQHKYPKHTNLILCADRLQKQESFNVLERRVEVLSLILYKCLKQAVHVMKQFNIEVVL